MKGAELSVQTKKRDNWMVVEFTGKPTVKSYKTLKSIFESLKSESAYFLFDLKDVTFLDSTILESFAQFAKYIREQNGVIAMINLNSIIKELIEIFCLGNYFHVFSDREEAEEFLQNQTA